jgi:hypothetical protein
MKRGGNREDGTMTRPLVATLLAGLLVLAGCVHHHHHDSHGKHHAKKHAAHHAPPPHAPAHGYRHHHHHGADLRFDRHLGVYVVIGHPHHFFHDGRWYRRHDGHWEHCKSWKKGHWKRTDVAVVPMALVRHYDKKHGKAKRHGHGHGPAKHDD